MNPPAPVTLTGLHVRLVPLALDHVPALCEVGVDPELWRLTVEHVGSADAAQAAGTALPFGVIHAPSSRVAGTTRYLPRRHAFETLECARVEFKTDVLNQRSRAALLRIGASEEGVLRGHMRTRQGRRRDTVFSGILRDEWPAVRGRLQTLLASGGGPAALS